jgi:hypothetical protein
MLTFFVAAVLHQSTQFPVRWFYMQTNLAVVANVDNVISVMERAKKAGYNGMVITDSKFSILDNVYKPYFANTERVRLKGEELGLTIIPAVADMGYSGGLLSHDVNLIEGQPVKKAPFVVKGGVLTPERSVTYANSGMEQANGDKLTGFSYQDGPGTESCVDAAIKHSGNQSIRFENYKGVNARVMHPLAVKPWQQYRVRFWLKTEAVVPVSEFRCFAMSESGKVLSFMDTGAKMTQDWTEHTIIFNSQNFDKVTLYTGLWSCQSGKFWLDDISVEEAGFLNVLRRPGAPVKLEYENGQAIKEGEMVERVEDTHLGTTPWMGEYTFTQATPLIKTRLSEGTRVFASFTHAVATESGKTAICPSEPKTMDILKSTFGQVASLWKAKSLFLAHDEIRVAGVCPLCETKTPGQIYSENLRQCVNLSRKTVPGGMTLVWSDMFDPFHNAVDNYYLSGGTWKESWRGLTPDVTIMNWNSGKPAESLGFFAGLGCHQILSGFYDAPVDGIKPWLAAAKKVKGIDGVMYTTWVNDYSKLEAFAKVAFNR